MRIPDLYDREVLIYNGRAWLALECDYWVAVLRLIRVYGLEPTQYALPLPGNRTIVSSNEARELRHCLVKSLDDIPNEDLWRHYKNEPDADTTPPHEFFSGVGVSYIQTLLDFISDYDFVIEISEPGTNYRFQGEMIKWPE